ncbi:hypothetical protein ITG10_22945 [Vibrio sp. ED004]|uniref:hypothetical protein n=1 Tax=Vibrio sp. ED004 TaxID=2785124 RepID=UPI0020641FFD|nr:hypothetical protein [Vibrio sp. ED004]UPR58641.1 hypothetical protein ITG10_22945 [Vibrio sp. ED004]
MKVTKSSRHSKITGDFTENLVLYWLSKYGFESTIVDHTGIDIIARNPNNNELMGISVKSRSRNTGKEKQYLSIGNDHFPKVEAACTAFGCIPYFAIVIDELDTIKVFITSMEHLLSLHPMRKKCSGWKMTDKWVLQYEKDPEIKIFEFKHSTSTWW